MLRHSDKTFLLLSAALTWSGLHALWLWTSQYLRIPRTHPWQTTLFSCNLELTVILLPRLVSILPLWRQLLIWMRQMRQGNFHSMVASYEYLKTMILLYVHSNLQSYMWQVQSLDIARSLRSYSTQFLPPVTEYLSQYHLIPNLTRAMRFSCPTSFLVPFSNSSLPSFRCLPSSPSL